MMNDMMTTIDNFSTDIKKLSVPVAGIALVVIGILWMFAKDPQKKEAYVGWFVNVAIGFAIVWLGTSIVTWFTGTVVGAGSGAVPSTKG